MTSYSENCPPRTVANRGGKRRGGRGRGGNRGAASQALTQRVAFNNNNDYNDDDDTPNFEEDPEKFGTTEAKDCGSYWLCENLPEESEYREILKIHANPQVEAAPGRLLEFPLLPETFDIWVNGTEPGPVRAIYKEDGKGGKKGNRPYDVVYHDPTKPGNLDFTKAEER